MLHASHSSLTRQLGIYMNKKGVEVVKVRVMEVVADNHVPIADSLDIYWVCLFSLRGGLKVNLWFWVTE